MSELYWIGVIGNLWNVFFVILILFFFWLILCLLLYFVMGEDLFIYNTSKDLFKKMLGFCMWVVMVSTIATVFIPTKKELYVIFGVGPTIDFIKSNEKAQELTEKCIDALELFIGSINEDKK